MMPPLQTWLGAFSFVCSFFAVILGLVASGTGSDEVLAAGVVVLVFAVASGIWFGILVWRD